MIPLTTAARRGARCRRVGRVRIALGAALAATIGFSAAPAAAGAWKVDLSHCPDYLADLTRQAARGAPEHAPVGRTRAMAMQAAPSATTAERDAPVLSGPIFCPAEALIFDPDAPGPTRPWRKSDGLVLRQDALGFYQLTPRGVRLDVEVIAHPCGDETSELKPDILWTTPFDAPRDLPS